jgi:hypothetical protein
MNAIEAVAEAIWNARFPGDMTWAEAADDQHTFIQRLVNEVTDQARAAIAALAAQGDITDDEIAEAFRQSGAESAAAAVCSEFCAMPGCDCESSAKSELIAAVRALLARQAAVHATEVEGFEQRLNLAHYAYQEAKARVAEAELNARSMTEAYQAASASLARANQAVEAMDKNFDRQEAETESVLDGLRAENAALRATVERVRALCGAPTDHLPFAAVMVADLRAALADPKEDA